MTMSCFLYPPPCSGVPTHLKSQGNFLVREKSGNFVGSRGKPAMIIHVVWVLSSVVTDQLHHTRSFIGAYSSKSTLSVIVLVFLKIMAMERSRCREEEPTTNNIKLVVVSASGQGIVRNIVREKSGNFIFEFEWEPCPGIANHPHCKILNVTTV